MLKMFDTFKLLIFVVYFAQLKTYTPCQDWSPYKDEKCFKILDDTLRTYDEAEKSCAKLEDSPTLVIVHSTEEQNFLSNYLFNVSKKVDNFWLGAKYSGNSFAWIDNSKFDYSNWVSAKGAKNKTNYCLQMQSEEETVGKWLDEPCEKKNAVVCQKMQTWTLARLQKSHLDTRKELRDELDSANKNIVSLEQKLEAEKKKSDDLKQNLMPIGFIYPQLPNEKPPTELWSTMTWNDVSATYAGVFFRVNGAGSEPFGSIQSENIPRLVRIEREHLFLPTDFRVEKNFTLNIDSVNDWIYTGDDAKESILSNSLRFVMSGGEARPRNMAVRIWKRTA